MIAEYSSALFRGNINIEALGHLSLVSCWFYAIRHRQLHKCLYARIKSRNFD
jgi:hypothetical protein